MAEKQRSIALNVRRFHDHLYKVLNHDERRVFVQVFNKFQKKRNVAALVTDLRTLLDNPEKEEIVLHLLNVLRPSEKEQFFNLWMRTSAFEALYKGNVKNGDDYTIQDNVSPYRNSQYGDTVEDYHTLELSTVNSNTSSNHHHRHNHRNNVSTDSDYDSSGGFQIMRPTHNKRPIYGTTNDHRKNHNIKLSPGKSKTLPTKRRHHLDNDDMRLNRNSIQNDRLFNGDPSSKQTGGPTSGLKLPSKTVLLKRARDVGFGFSIRGGKEHGIGIYISAVLTESPASQAGLKKGDLLLKVNGMGFQKISHSAAVQVIKDSRKLKMNVFSHGYIPGSRIAQVEYRWVGVNGRPVSPLVNFRNEVDNQKSDMMLLRHDDERKVNVFTDVNSKLGIYIRGGNEFGLGIFIAGVDRGSVAEKSGIKIGDQILNVNGVDFSKISHDDAVKALKHSKMMTLILHDVGKIPFARVLYDKTEWLDEDNNQRTIDNIGPTKRPIANTQDEVLNSMFRQGIAGSQLLHRMSVGVSAEALIQENARSVLDENEMKTLKYYLNEYTQGNIEVHGLIISLTELFDTPEKLSLFAEIRNIIQPQDIHTFDESVMTRESSASRRSSSPYKSNFGLRTPAPFVPEFLAPDSSSSQGYDGTESDSSLHYEQPSGLSSSSIRRHQHYENNSGLLPTSAIGETDDENNSELNGESSNYQNGSLTEESNWYQREIEKRNQMKHVNKTNESANERTKHTNTFYEQPTNSHQLHNNDIESSSHTGDDSLTSDINEEDINGDDTDEQIRTIDTASPRFPRVISRSHILQDVEEDVSLAVSSLSSAGNSEHEELDHEITQAFSVHTQNNSLWNPESTKDDNENNSEVTDDQFNENTPNSTSNDPIKIFQFNITPRKESPVFNHYASNNSLSPLSPSESRFRKGSLVQNGVKTFDTDSSVYSRPHSNSISLPKSPLFTSSERPPLNNGDINNQLSDRSNTPSPDIIVPSDAWRHHHRKISKTRSHSVSGEHPRIQIGAPKRKGKSVFHNAYLNDPKRYSESVSNSTESLNRIGTSPRVSLGSKTGHYQSENDLGYHNDQFSVSVASRIQLLQEKNNDVGNSSKRPNKLSSGSRTQSVEELSNVPPSKGPNSSRIWQEPQVEMNLTHAQSLSEISTNESYDFRAHESNLDRIESARQQQIYSSVSLDSLLNADYDAPIDKSLSASESHIQNFNFMKSMPPSINDSRSDIVSPGPAVTNSPDPIENEDGPTIGSVLSLAKLFESRNDRKKNDNAESLPLTDAKRSSRFSNSKLHSDDSQMSPRKMSNQDLINNADIPNHTNDFAGFQSTTSREVLIDKSYSNHGLSIRESKDLNGVEIASIDSDSESAAFHNKELEVGQIITSVDSESLKGLNASLAMLVLNRAFIYKDGHFMELKIFNI